MLLFIILFVGIINSIQHPNYDGITPTQFTTRPDTWGIEYRVGTCNNALFTKTLEINLTPNTNEADILIGFGTQDTFFALYMGMNI